MSNAWLFHYLCVYSLLISPFAHANGVWIFPPIHGIYRFTEVILFAEDSRYKYLCAMVVPKFNTCDR